MTPEEKDLLLKDLSARLPYGVKVQYNGSSIRLMQAIGIEENEPYFKSKEVAGWLDVGSCKPYLRPMSSMTEEEKKEYIKYAGYEIEESVNGRHYEYYLKDFCGTPDNPSVNTDGIDWLNKNMFDFRGLIDKGLAIEVTEENNPYKD